MNDPIKLFAQISPNFTPFFSTMARHQWFLWVILSNYYVGYHAFVMPRFRHQNSMSCLHKNLGVETTNKFPSFRHHLQHLTHARASLSQLSASLSTRVLNMAISFLQLLINILKKFKPKASPTFQQTINDEKVIIRPANIDDTSLILDFILELADFEQLKDQVTATSSSLQPKLFPLDPSLPHPRVLILEVNDQPG